MYDLIISGLSVLNILNIISQVRVTIAERCEENESENKNKIASECSKFKCRKHILSLAMKNDNTVQVSLLYCILNR